MAVLWDDNLGWVDANSAIARARRLASGGPAHFTDRYDLVCRRRPAQPVAREPEPDGCPELRSAAEIAEAVLARPSMTRSELRAAEKAWIAQTRRETAVEDMLDGTINAERAEIRAVRRLATAAARKRRRRRP